MSATAGKRLGFKIPHLSKLASCDGLPGLLSTSGAKIAWYDRASHYVDRLNTISDNNNSEGSIRTFIEKFDATSSPKALSTYASLLWNLEFAYDSLSPKANAPPNFPKSTLKDLLRTPDLALNFANEPLSAGCTNLHNEILKSFGSVVEFRTLLLNSNLAINGDGYTWLALRMTNLGSQQNAILGQGNLVTFNTYNAGSPLVPHRTEYFSRLHKELASREQAAEGQSNIEDLLSEEDPLENAIKNARYDKSQIIPLLAIDASPKAWLHDYGVFGKRAYLDALWERIDWQTVQFRMP